VKSDRYFARFCRLSPYEILATGNNRYLDGSNESELADYKDNAGSHCNRTNQDCHGYHVTLEFPVNYFTGGTTATEKRVGILLSTIRARPFDGLKHPLILACRQLAVKH